MSKAEVDALNEVARHNERGVCYWFRAKTMERLQARGLVETWTPPSVAERPRLKQRPWRLTDEGRAQRARLNTLALVQSKDTPHAL